jgi:rhodanese-related sulfurtransferase
VPQDIQRERVAELLDSGFPVVDVLPPKEHEELRIAGSEGIWLRELDAGSVEHFSTTDPIALYCHDYL